MSRHRSRERALQILFQIDIRSQAPEEAIQHFYTSLSREEEAAPLPDKDPFMEALVRGTAALRQEIDRRIAAHSEHWRLERMPVVDRNILRLAVYEMMRESTPPVVVIDEALELARRFSTEEAVAFINGVLDAIRKELVAEAASGAPPGSPA
ncbi:MAG: transcription antitermination factor NusB [Bryobacterales bacterium]|nr:transcription antitermination factor NusB [Bryobacteraceae bacterium]MDW8355709.1 transcription antitermination factor NusB [Bryobacterales bacterium]